MKTSTLSVRVSSDDAAFLAELDIEDAVSPSEKLRALLHAEQRRQQGGHDVVEATYMFRDMLRASARLNRRIELMTGLRSNFLTKIYDRIPEIVAIAYTGVDMDANEDEKVLVDAARKFENALLDYIFEFVQETVELGLTTKNRCYDPDAINDRLTPVLEILDLIKLTKDKQKGA